MWRRIRLDRVPVPTLGAAPPAARVLRRVPHFALQPTRWNILHWCSWAAALAIELWLVAELQGGQIFGWEQSVTRSLQDVPGKGLVFDVTSTLTNTLSAPFLLIFATIAAFMMVGGHRWATSVLLLSFPLHVLAQFPKALVDRPRPSSAFDGIEGVGGLQSFPSGHAEYVITFYGFLAYLVFERATSLRTRAAIVGAWMAFVLATGFGRVAMGRHWPIDVLASYVVGLGLLSGLIWIHRALKQAEAAANHM